MTALHVSSAVLTLRGRSVLRGISHEFSPGLVGLVGPNGAGKSSLLRVCAGLWRLDAGRVDLNGRPIHAIAATERARQMAYLPPERDIVWPLPARDVVRLGRHPYRGAFAPWSDEDEAAAARAVAATEVGHLLDRPVSELSSGERTRVLLARALCVDAPILLVDEAIAALDPAHQLQVLFALEAEAAKGRLIIAVLHDLGFAARFCSEVLVMAGGALHCSGAPADVLTPRLMSEVFAVDACLSGDGDDRQVITRGLAKHET